VTFVENYLRDKIERRAAYYEAQVQKANNDEYRVEIEKLAAKTRDDALAWFFRHTTRPARIRSALQQIRRLASAGKLIEADRRLESLRSTLEFIEAHLKRPYLRAGLGVSLGGKKAARLRWTDTAEVHLQMREMFESERKKGLLKTAAEKERSQTVSPRP
jgi:hypothetical protein